MRKLLGEYECYRIFRLDLTHDTEDYGSVIMAPIPPDARLNAIDDEALRNRVAHAGSGSLGFGAWEAGTLVAGCWFWTPERFREDLVGWCLKPGEVWCDQTQVAERARGRGLGGAVMRYAAREMARLGYRRTYCRIWHSHHDSLRMIAKAGWRQTAWVFRARPMGIAVRFTLKRFRVA